MLAALLTPNGASDNSTLINGAFNILYIVLSVGNRLFEQK
jgi:hypothetical protein